MNSKFDIIVFIFGLVLILAFGWFIATQEVTIVDPSTQPVQSTLYGRSGRIIKVDYANALVTFEDSNGNTWSFNGTEDWAIGDWVACVMDTQGTTTIYDDIIISSTYEAWGN